MELNPLLLSTAHRQFCIFVVSFHAIFPVSTIVWRQLSPFLEILLFQRPANPLWERLFQDSWVQSLPGLFAWGVSGMGSCSLRV